LKAIELGARTIEKERVTVVESAEEQQSNLHPLVEREFALNVSGNV